MKTNKQFTNLELLMFDCKTVTKSHLHFTLNTKVSTYTRFNQELVYTVTFTSRIYLNIKPDHACGQRKNVCLINIQHLITISQQQIYTSLPARASYNF